MSRRPVFATVFTLVLLHAALAPAMLAFEIVLDPAQPVAGEPIAIEVGGSWPNGCVPRVLGPVVGNRVVALYAVSTEEPTLFCTAAVTPFEQRLEVDGLEAGTWTFNLFVVEPRYRGSDLTRADPEAELVDTLTVAVDGAAEPQIELLVVPSSPTTGDEVSLVVRGVWPNDCPPEVIGHQILESFPPIVSVDLLTPRTFAPCRLVSTPIEQAEAIGELTAGPYRARAVVIDQLGPDGQPMLLAETEFEVTETGTASSDALLLGDGRFELTVDWRTASGGSGSGSTVPVESDDSGIFWFFDQDNWELMVKVLDGCAINDHFWVFSAGSTNVGYTLAVTDTATGKVRVYQNPVERTASTITDTEAFATCAR